LPRHKGALEASMTTPGSTVRPAAREDITPAAEAAGWRSAGLVLLVASTSLFLVWQMKASLLVIFAGILIATFFDACARALAPVVRVSRGWRLMLVLVALGVLAGLGVAWGMGSLPDQLRYLLRVIDAQLDILQSYLLNFGVELFGPEGGRDFSRWFPDHSKLFGHAQMAIGTASSFLANAAIMLFLGIFFAFNPPLYRDAILLLVKPAYRARAGDVLNEMGTVLQFWFVGQVARIALMTVCVWIVLYLIGLPGAFLLGVQAGLSNFIPYLGPIAAAIPIGLVAMPLGPSMLIWSVGLYTIVQSIEGYVIGPLILRQAVDIPPAWILVAIVLLGSLFGVIGIALAVPLIAIGRIAILRFYVEDYLGDTSSRTPEPQPAGDDAQPVSMAGRS
jgi:predicted PurR-regulated permease PerM